MTELSKVKTYVEEHGSITARECFIDLRINSPRKVFSTMNRLDKSFYGEWTKEQNSAGEWKKFKRYRYHDGCEMDKAGIRCI